MIKERMIELQLLLSILNGIKREDYYIKDNVKHLLSRWGDEYNLNKMQERANNLFKEFLHPYVINSDSKE